MTLPIRSRSTATRVGIAAFAGLGIVTALAGCSSAAATTGTASGGSTSAAASGTATTSYKDGVYTEEGSYQSPGGNETISVSLTLAKNLVTAVTVKTIKADSEAREYEEKFESGISRDIVGKSLDSLNVSRVAGSSLTSQGFNAAVTKIKADAKS